MAIKSLFLPAAWITLAVLLCVLPPLAEAQQSNLELQSLLDAVEQGRAADADANAQRIENFRVEQNRQQTRLTDIRNQRTDLEARSTSKESAFEDNESTIAELEKRLQERMGTLKELFGVLQQTAGDTQGQFQASLTQLEQPERSDFLIDFAARMGQANRLPEISEIERLWFNLIQEMAASGQITTAQRPIITDEGLEMIAPVTRLGLFNVISEGKYLKHIPETGRLVEFSRQPASRYLTGINAIADKSKGIVPVAIDPVRGQLLEVLTQAPNLIERISQGGIIGYSIIALGCIGVLAALLKLALLLWQGSRIAHQLRNEDEPENNNSLGRILIAARSKEAIDVETLEMRMGEAVMQETPKINAYIPLFKIIAAVAPLMGLLGTVTGMIITFQAITLFGAGDPRLMAGGISQALVTTVLGLCVAIPMLLLHNLTQMRAKSLSEILQHKAIAVVAQRLELEGNNVGLKRELAA